MENDEYPQTRNQPSCGGKEWIAVRTEVVSDILVLAERLIRSLEQDNATLCAKLETIRQHAKELTGTEDAVEAMNILKRTANLGE